jgi:hypothetical protein
MIEVEKPVLAEPAPMLAKANEEEKQIISVHMVFP